MIDFTFCRVDAFNGACLNRSPIIDSPFQNKILAILNYFGSLTSFVASPRESKKYVLFAVFTCDTGPLLLVKP